MVILFTTLTWGAHESYTSLHLLILPLLLLASQSTGPSVLLPVPFLHTASAGAPAGIFPRGPSLSVDSSSPASHSTGSTSLPVSHSTPTSSPLAYAFFSPPTDRIRAAQLLHYRWPRRNAGFLCPHRPPPLAQAWRRDAVEVAACRRRAMRWWWRCMLADSGERLGVFS